MDSWININETLPTKSGWYECKLREVKHYAPACKMKCFFNGADETFYLGLQGGWVKAQLVTHWKEND
jgi:hypothetical protein